MFEFRSYLNGNVTIAINGTSQSSEWHHAPLLRELVVSYLFVNTNLGHKMTAPTVKSAVLAFILGQCRVKKRIYISWWNFIMFNKNKKENEPNGYILPAQYKGIINEQFHNNSNIVWLHPTCTIQLCRGFSLYNSHLPGGSEYIIKYCSQKCHKNIY